MKPTSDGKSAKLIISCGGWIVFMVYLATLAPSLTWAHDGADGGDLAAAVLSGGIPHPPGYPTYLLLGELFVRIPLGDPAFRLNLLSAAAAAGAAALLGYGVSQWIAGKNGMLIGLISTLVMGFSPLLWAQAVITEVYAPAALVASSILLIVMKKRIGRSSVFLVGLLLGIGLGIHPTLIFLSPLIALRFWKGRFTRGVVLGFFGSFVFGLTPYLWLMARGWADAPVQWADASNLEGWWRLVSGQLYRSNIFGLALNEYAGRIPAAISILIKQFTPLGAVLALFGFDHVRRVDRTLAWGAALTIGAFALFAIGYNTTDSYLYLLPILPMLAFLMGVGLSEISRKVSVRAPGMAAAAVISMVIITWQLAANWQTIDLHEDTGAVAFGEAIMESAPQNAVLITAKDHHTFSLWYFHYGLGQRPDLSIVDRDLWAFSWYRQGALGLPTAEKGPYEDLDEALILVSRPICSVEQGGVLKCR